MRRNCSYCGIGYACWGTTFKTQNARQRIQTTCSYEDKEPPQTGGSYLDGIRAPISATGFLHCFSEEFVASDAIAAMQAGRPWGSRREEFLRDDGDLMSPDEIACKWAKNGAVQRARGTLLHYHAEQLLNDRVIEEHHSPESKQIIEVVDAIKSRWEVRRAEFSMLHCGLRLAGQAELLCRDADGRLVIIDWKRAGDQI